MPYNDRVTDESTIDIVKKALILSSQIIDIAKSISSPHQKQELSNAQKIIQNHHSATFGNTKQHGRASDVPLMIIRYLNHQVDCDEFEYIGKEIAQINGYKQSPTATRQFVGDAFEDSKGRVWALVAYCEWEDYEDANGNYIPYQECEYDENYDPLPIPVKKYRGIHDVSNLSYAGREKTFFRTIDKSGVYYEYWDESSAIEYSAWGRLPKTAKKTIEEATIFFQMTQAISEIANINTEKK